MAAKGGPEPFTFEFSNIPEGWTYLNNTFTIPNILTIANKKFNIQARVSDGYGDTFEATIELGVEGTSIQSKIVGQDQSAVAVSQIQK